MSRRSPSAPSTQPTEAVRAGKAKARKREPGWFNAAKNYSEATSHALKVHQQVSSKLGKRDTEISDEPGSTAIAQG